MASNAQRRQYTLWKRQNGLCWLCLRPINLLSTSKKTGPSIDHLLPKALGGNGVHYNSLLAHQRCNRQRGHAPESWTRDEIFEVLNMFTCGVAQWQSGRLISDRSKVQPFPPLPFLEINNEALSNMRPMGS